MRFLHLADVHLDAPFATRSPRLRRLLRRASREAFQAGVELALDESLDACLIAGDLFDRALISLPTEGFLVEQLQRLEEAGIPVVYATGNHDPGTASGPAVPWPDNVTVVSSPEPRRIPVEGRTGGGVVGWVSAAGHDGPRVTRDLAKAFPRPSGPGPEVALLHTQVVGARSEEAHDPYAPSELSTLRSSGYDYWALGHVHQRQELSRDPPIHYPGSTQGRTPAETGPRGGLVVHLGEGAPQVRFEPLSRVRWEKLRIQGLEEVSTHHLLVSSLKARFQELRRQSPGLPGTEWILVAELAGPSPLWERLREGGDVQELEEDLASRLGAVALQLRIDGLEPPVRPEDHLRRQDVLGESLRLLRAIRRGDTTLPELRPEDLGGFEAKGPGSLDAYVASLLEGGEGELLARLLERPGEEGPG